jgi:hypothetical protein
MNSSEERLFDLDAEAPVEQVRFILAAQSWPSNADLIADAARLGYLRGDVVVDMTYGRGVWWDRYRPPGLVAHDIATDGVDFRALPEADGSVDVVAFDPPYIPQVRVKDSTVGDFLHRYGLSDGGLHEGDLRAVIDAGIHEAFRVLRPAGRMLMKAQNFVDGGYRPFAYESLRTAQQAGFRLDDEFVHLRPPGPLSSRCRQQHHARRNYSHLFVLTKPKLPRAARNV